MIIGHSVIVSAVFCKRLPIYRASRCSMVVWWPEGCAVCDPEETRPRNWKTTEKRKGNETRLRSEAGGRPGPVPASLWRTETGQTSGKSLAPRRGR